MAATKPSAEASPSGQQGSYRLEVWSGERTFVLLTER